MRRGRLVFAALVMVAVLGGAAAVVVHRRPGSGRADAMQHGSDATRAPAGVRIRVQVLNGTRTRGLARRATAYLRDLGFDVVEVGTTRVSGDTTTIYDLSGHPDWAATLAASFAPARVIARRDSSRYLDISVVLGASWRAPAEPFYP